MEIGKRLMEALGMSARQPATFSALRTYSPTTTGGGLSGVTPNSIGNPDLKPERGKELEVGFDASAFQDRLSVEFNAYRRTTTDAILAATVSPSSGFAGSRFTNIGMKKRPPASSQQTMMLSTISSMRSTLR